MWLLALLVIIGLGVFGFLTLKLSAASDVGMTEADRLAETIDIIE